METEEVSDFATGQEIAKMFRVSNSTVNLWKRQGMPFFGKSSCARFNKAEVTKWQRSQSQLPVTKGKRSGRPVSGKVAEPVAESVTESVTESVAEHNE